MTFMPAPGSQVALGCVALGVLERRVLRPLGALERASLAEKQQLRQAVVGLPSIRECNAHLRRRPIQQGAQSGSFVVCNAAHGLRVLQAGMRPAVGRAWKSLSAAYSRGMAKRSARSTHAVTNRSRETRPRCRR